MIDKQVTAEIFDLQIKEYFDDTLKLIHYTWDLCQI